MSIPESNVRRRLALPALQGGGTRPKGLVVGKTDIAIISALKSCKCPRHAETAVFKVQPATRAQFTELMADDAALWRQAIEAAPIKLEG